MGRSVFAPAVTLQQRSASVSSLSSVSGAKNAIFSYNRNFTVGALSSWWRSAQYRLPTPQRRSLFFYPTGRRMSKKVRNTKKALSSWWLKRSVSAPDATETLTFFYPTGRRMSKKVQKSAQFLMMGLCSGSMERSVLSGCRLTRSPPPPPAVNSRLFASVSRVWDRLYNTPSPTVHTWT